MLPKLEIFLAGGVKTNSIPACVTLIKHDGPARALYHNFPSLVFMSCSSTCPRSEEAFHLTTARLRGCALFVLLQKCFQVAASDVKISLLVPAMLCSGCHIW